MPEIARRGLMLVLSSPSGAGKTSISRAILEEDDNLFMSISATTRPPRPGEEDGKDYFFYTKDEFKAAVNRGEFLEHATVFSNMYGTPEAPVEEALQAGRDVLFDVDWQGTQQMAQKKKNDLVTIFILPPSLVELEERLRNRAQDSDEVVRDRMSKAMDEISHWPEYNYIVVNKDLEESIAQVKSIIQAERLKRERLEGLYEFVGSMRNGPDAD